MGVVVGCRGSLVCHGGQDGVIAGHPWGVWVRMEGSSIAFAIQSALMVVSRLGALWIRGVWCTIASPCSAGTVTAAGCSQRKV